MSRFTGFSEKPFFLKKNLKYGRKGSDAIALGFLKKLYSTDCSIWVLERLDF